MNRRRALLATVVAVLAIIAGMTVWSLRPDPQAPIAPQSLRIPVGAEADGSAVTLDADLYLPQSHAPAPAVLLAHGFGGSKADLRADAQRLASEGYVVLAYTARGFGRSGGLIHLMDPAYEVADASALIDSLGANARVLRDASGDPRVAVMGGSYGGALALMAASRDPRVDSVVAMITWHDLADAFFPNAAAIAGEAATPGPFKQLWAAAFLIGSQSGAGGGADASGACGRFEPTLCREFVRAAETGQPSPALLDLLRKHSPATDLARVKAPVYLVQGMTDTLFGIDQADATARTLLADGVPVAVRWTNGGHDGSGTDAAATVGSGSAAARSEREDVTASIDTWLNGALRQRISRQSELPIPAFTYAVRPRRGQNAARVLSLPAYDPAAVAGRVGSRELALHGVGGGRLLNPPGGVPSAITSVPSGPDLSAAPSYSLAALPGQSVAFDTSRLTESLTAVGAPWLTLDVTSSGSEVTLYASLWQVQGESARLVRPLTAPLRFATEPRRRTTVAVTLPMATWQLPAGSTWRVLISATDAAYRGPVAARTDAITLDSPALILPVADGTPLGGPALVDRETAWVAAATLALLALLTGAALVRGGRRRRPDRFAAPWPRAESTPDPSPGRPDEDPGHLEEVVAAGVGSHGIPAREEASVGGMGHRGVAVAAEDGSRGIRAGDADAPVTFEVRGLVKVYGDGHRAVDDVSWRAERGQVVGLLGPNGAGKTTTLRMVVGLISADAGETHILGQRVRPGAAVLANVGTLIEGPGFVPHLTGRQNLHAYWAATGRPAHEADLEEALDVAALGGAIDRPVRSYSHGMRQRLGIAQAMLGRPAVLILDEPANGLDPPQIAALRPILQTYAAAGRTVIVSSHLLAEVEQTCSHVVVMQAGRVVAAGAVADLGVTRDRHLEDVFLDTIAGGRPVLAGNGAVGGPGSPGPAGHAGPANHDGYDGHDGATSGVDTRTDRLRQIRPR